MYVCVCVRVCVYMCSQKAVARAESLNLSNGVQSSIGAVHLPELDTSLDPLVIGRLGGIVFGRSARTDIVDLCGGVGVGFRF